MVVQPRWLVLGGVDGGLQPPLHGPYEVLAVMVPLQILPAGGLGANQLGLLPGPGIGPHIYFFFNFISP